MSRLSVMSSEEEARLATRIANLRRDYWRAILAYPPFVPAISELVKEKLPIEDLPVESMAQVDAAIKALRGRENRANREALKVEVDTLAEALGHVDVDGIASDIIAADLDRLAAQRRDGLTLAVRQPPRGSAVFEAYVQSVRRSGSALRRSKNEFVKANLRLVVSIARRFNHGRMPLQDLIQEGNIGLMKAVDRFDHRKGYRFSTYGSWWIRHAISRAIADKARAVRLPVHMLDAYHKVTRAKRELETASGEVPGVEAIAKHTGLPVAKVERMDEIALEQPLSLDRTVSEGDGRRAIDFLEDEDGPLPGERIEAQSMSLQVQELITELKPMEADILRKRFGLIDEKELTLKEIGEQYSLSRERIRQLQEKVLGKIRRELQRREAM
jgi:RNA polymerase primary sigma factor